MDDDPVQPSKRDLRPGIGIRREKLHVELRPACGVGGISPLFSVEGDAAVPGAVLHDRADEPDIDGGEHEHKKKRFENAEAFLLFRSFSPFCHGCASLPGSDPTMNGCRTGLFPAAASLFRSSVAHSREKGVDCGKP